MEQTTTVKNIAVIVPNDILIYKRIDTDQSLTKKDEGKLERFVNFINRWSGIKSKWADLSLSIRFITVIKLIILTAIIVGLIYFGIIALLGALSLGVSGFGAVALAQSLGFSGMKTLSIFGANIPFSKAALGILTYAGIGFGTFGLVAFGSRKNDGVNEIDKLKFRKSVPERDKPRNDNLTKSDKRKDSELQIDKTMVEGYQGNKEPFNYDGIKSWQV